MRFHNHAAALVLALSLVALASGCFGGGSKTSPLAAGAAPATGAAAGNTYVLQSGDTLFSVAIKLGVPQEQQAQWVAEVLRLNGIADATLLKSGVELTLPKPQATPRPTGTTQAAAR